MADLAERIRDLVDTSEAPVTFAEIKALVAHDRGTSGLAPPLMHRHRSVLVGAGVTCALVIGLVFELMPSAGPQSQAAAALSKVAEVASLRPAPPIPAAGQYLYYEVTEGKIVTPPEPVGVSPTGDLVTESTQTWVAADGHGRQRAVVLGSSPLVPSAGPVSGSGTTAHLGPIGYDISYPSAQTEGGPLVPGSGGLWRLSYPDSSEVPTDPGALKAYIVSTFNVTGGPTTIFLLAGDTLQVGAQPALRAGLFQVIQSLPGIKDLGPTKDQAGQMGTGVAIDGFGNEYALVFNPNTSAVLGETVHSLETKDLGGEVIPAGTLVGFKNYGRTGITESTVTVPNSSG